MANVKRKLYSTKETFVISMVQHDIIRFDGILLGVVKTNLKTGKVYVSPPGKDYYKRVIVP